MSSKTKDRRERTPRWRDAGPDRCGFCLQRLALDIEYRCFDCDQAACALCIVRVTDTRRSHCPTCAPTESG